MFEVPSLTNGARSSQLADHIFLLSLEAQTVIGGGSFTLEVTVCPTAMAAPGAFGSCLPLWQGSTHFPLPPILSGTSCDEVTDGVTSGAATFSWCPGLC